MSQKPLPAGRALPDNGCTLSSGRGADPCPRLFSCFPHESTRLPISQPPHLPLPSTESPGTLNSHFPPPSAIAAATLIAGTPEKGGLGPAAPQGHLHRMQERGSGVGSACVPAARHSGARPPSPGPARIRAPRPHAGASRPTARPRVPSPRPAALSLRLSAAPRPYGKPVVVPSAACPKVPSRTCSEIGKLGFVFYPSCPFPFEAPFSFPRGCVLF